MTFRHLLLIFLAIQILNLAGEIGSLFDIEFNSFLSRLRIILYIVFYGALTIKLLSHPKVRDFLNA